MILIVQKKFSYIPKIIFSMTKKIHSPKYIYLVPNITIYLQKIQLE